MTDLTRWNRAGLSRFDYVDGNAAVWLEELRLAMLARFVRGADGDARSAEFWRRVLAERPSAVDAGHIAEYAAKLAWPQLFVPVPAKPETTADRHERLHGAYRLQSPDQAREIMRAFARAAHVLLGHVNAYANEGYLRTATQWDAMRKLAAMIGYEPAPAASASTVVGLVVETGGGTVEVPRGVAMSFTPPGGGKPVIFETVQTIDAHPDLNAARAAGFDRDERDFDPVGPNDFTLPKGASPNSGDLVILTTAGWPAWSTSILNSSIAPDRKTASITLDGKSPGERRRFASVLHGKAERVLRARRRSSGGPSTVVRTDTPSRFIPDTLVLFRDPAGVLQPAVVRSVQGDRVELEAETAMPDDVDLIVANQYRPGAEGYISTTPDVTGLWFRREGSVEFLDSADLPFIPWTSTNKRGFRTNIDTNAAGATRIEHRFELPSEARGVAFGIVPGDDPVKATKVAASGGDAGRTIEFSGKPSGALVTGSWFLAQGSGEPVPLQVQTVRIAADSYHVTFDSELKGRPTDHEFHGPMLVGMRLVDHDRGHAGVFSGGIMLTCIGEEAQKLVKTGRKILVEDQGPAPRPAAQLTITAVTPRANGIADKLLIQFAENPSVLAGMLSGWTVFRLNTALATHGESRGGKALGSGNAELLQQSFPLAVKGVSFIPSNAAESGVVPDVDVTVQNVSWAYRDLSDPTANDTDSWSIRANEDDTLEIVFRRRLPTGTNNIAVRSHRVGTGPAGNAVPACSFTKPSKKHRWVREIVQPIAASGGAAREPVSSMRETAPSRLAANGRAVSLSDFEKLVSRHAGVWQARAVQLPEVGASVRIIVVPADGGSVTPAFADELARFVKLRAIPGARPRVEEFSPVHVRLAATIRADLRRYDENDLIEAGTAELFETFSLRRRGLGQRLFVGEVLAALERIEGVENAVATVRVEFEDRPMNRRPMTADGVVQAIFPNVDQVAYAPSMSFIEVAVEAIR